MINEIHATCLSEALVKILKAPSDGTMAYVRSIPTEAMSALFGGQSFQVPGWDVYFVADHIDPERRTITADQAVDLREEKRGSVLLLVDTKRAGAGMDGIYSAVREVSEKELLPKAISAAEKRFPSRSQKDFADWAVKQARKLGKTHTISPWREFDFYARCAETPDLIGKYVTLLGLWPIATGNGLHKEDLAVSAQIVERILLPSGAINTPQAKVQTLLLPESDVTRAADLERFIRDTGALRWTEMAERLADLSDLWLNNLKPGFNSQELISIELTEWQSKPDAAPLKWSGLALNSANEVEFLINDSSKLEVRWKTQPPVLKPASVEYKVSIVTGSDIELVSRQVSHTEKKEQKCIFTREDFADFEGTEKWQTKIVVHPVDEPPPSDTSDSGESARWRESREFILTFGSRDAAAKTGVGKKARALVEEAIKLDIDSFEAVYSQVTREDSQGFVSFNVNGKSGRVFRPELIKLIEEDWRDKNFAIGRWVVRVRADGSRAGEPSFLPADREIHSADSWKKLEDATRQLAQRALSQNGFVGLIYHNNDLAASYVNAWSGAIEAGLSELCIANTVEVQGLNGDTVGLIVLPSHPTRVAWHSAYDELAFHARFTEELSATETVSTLRSLDGSFVPMFLPGIGGGNSFVFGDSLGFYAAAMIQANEPEPQAMIAQMMRCLSAIPSDDVAPTVGSSTATAIGREIEKYSSLHPEYRTIHINALRAGDGKTVAQALGVSFSKKSDEEPEARAVKEQQGFVLNLFPSQESKNLRLVGRYFAEAAERRRSGVSTGTSIDDRWMLETYQVGNSTLPRLKWAKRSYAEPNTSAHVSIAFDIFDSQVEKATETDLQDSRPLEAFGLIPSTVRRFELEPVPTWVMTLAPQVEGEKHPVARVLTERLHKIHAAVVKSAVADSSSEARDTEKPWAVLRTRLKANQLDFIRKMHEISDWVVSVDRNAGLEYFDAPKSGTDVYETYVIDCVPERQDLDTLQLVTSTSKVDEVLRLLEDSLGDMALSRSPRNGRFLLANLKAVSGRLAMRLADHGLGRTEMIALAMFHAGCDKFSESADWLPLDKGFLVPLDDVRDLLPATTSEKSPDADAIEESDNSLMRADMVFVTLSRRNAIQFSFVEIKYRRLLKSARDPKLHEHIGKQVSNTRKRWIEAYFSPKLTQTQLVMRRKKLARALRFYLDKAARHLLDAGEYKRLSAAVDKLFRSETEISEDYVADRGYVFCPEHQGHIELISDLTECEVRMFGAESLPDLPYSPVQPASETEAADLTIEIAKKFQGDDLELSNPVSDGQEEIEIETVIVDTTESRSDDPKGKGANEQQTQLRTPDESVDLSGTSSSRLRNIDGLQIRLGSTLASESPVDWRVAINGNPHMLIAGLPGMGKTTCLINICVQLMNGGITPIVFSYHDDIEAKLASRFNQLQFVDTDTGLGFNPLQVVTPNVHGWLDNIGKLRDIFAAIYADLGDIQLNEIRESVKQSYVDVGYGQVESPEGLPTPKFKRFYEILRGKAKPNSGIIARLEELNDYGFFDSNAERGSILEFREPVIVRLHTTQNEVLQNAMASFVLLNIYQNMLLRGSQANLTHAVIFDEAHRAARLKLVPTMAKESRKFGVSMIVASQEAKDFSDSLYAAIANYLVLRVTETDAKALARNVVHSAEANSVAGRLKSLEKYTAMFFSEGRRPTELQLCE